MTIKVQRNAAGNCINFVGTSLPAYFNACLSGEVDSTDSSLINVINDVQTANNPNGEIRYEFYQIPYTEFADKDGNSFADAQAAADYITQEGNVLGVSDTGTSLNGITVNFRLDQTSTSVIMDNGSAFGVNTIKAVPDVDGTIHIHAIGAGVPSGSEEPDTHKHFEGLGHTNVQINGVPVSGGLNDVCNALNELFTVGAFESVVIGDPHSTMVADVGGTATTYTLEGNNAVDPIGDDIFTNSSSGNYAGLKTTETIDQAGEYFTFDIRGEGQIGFGLVHTDASFNGGFAVGNSSYADPASFAVTNSAHYGFQFSHWFHPTPNGSWTNYGANTGYIGGAGWSSSGWDQKQDWLDGNPVKIRVGIDENGFIAISSLQDDGSFVLHARTNYPVPQGSSFHLGVKTANASGRVASVPKVHLLEPAAPTMYFRYIESPDGNFEYPLFATAEEANYYDLNSGGTGTSHTHTYVDDATGTTWYMPDNGGTMTATSAPTGQTFLSNPVTYTEITSYTNADLTPPVFSATNITQEEGTSVNLQVTPAGASWSSSISISPSGSGLVYDGYSLVQGTLADVGADTVYTITVTRSNSYGSTTGSMTVTATDVAPVQTNTTPWTEALDFSGSNEHLKQVGNFATTNPMRMNDYATNIAPPSTAGYTANGASVRPWATAVVFKYDGNSSNQHIWNQGEGAGSVDDNIYLRLDASGYLYFGWGRQGALNECRFLYLGTSTNTNHWHGIYIAHNGTRLSGSNATAANLAAAFDIRWFSTNFTGGVFGSWMDNKSTAANWTAGSTGGRMDRSYTGDFTIGGRGNNRNFHGQVASMVVTTLRINQPMPSDAEIEEMIIDPMGWVDNYKVGNPFREPTSAGDAGYNFTSGTVNAGRATQVWLMGDGVTDSYANGIRNQLLIDDQNATKLQLNSMVSNDIQSVNIPGLT